MKLFNKWAENLELALLLGFFIAFLGLVFSPFFMDVSFLIAPVGSWAQVARVAGVVLMPLVITTTVYTIHFIYKEVM